LEKNKYLDQKQNQQDKEKRIYTHLSLLCGATRKIFCTWRKMRIALTYGNPISLLFAPDRRSQQNTKDENTPLKKKVALLSANCGGCNSPLSNFYLTNTIRSGLDRI